MSNVNEVSWNPNRAWWGILAVVGLDFVFLFIVLVLHLRFKFPAPIMIGLLSVFLYVAIILLVYCFTDMRLDSVGLNYFPFFKVLGFILLFLVGILIFETGWVYVIKVLGIKEPDNITPVKQLFGTGFIGLIVVFILTVLVAPIAEELFFRSFLYQSFRKRYGIWIGLFLSSLVFGLFHFSFIAALPVFIFIGVLLGYLFELFGSVYPSIILHALNNFFFFLVLIY